MSSVFDSQAFNANLFFPRQDNASTPRNSDNIQVDVGHGVIVHVRRHPSPKAQVSLLFFHGNGEIVSDYDNLAEHFNALGVELIVTDFRGYGRSSGFPTLRSTLEDAHKVFDKLKSISKFKEKICIYNIRFSMPNNTLSKREITVKTKHYVVVQPVPN